MTHALAGDAPYQVPRENRRWPALAMAVAMHAGLLAMLWVGVQWQNSQPVAVEAEVWDMKTEAAAPPAPPVQAQPEEPTPAEPPPARPPVAPPVAPPVEAPPAPEPDIALERMKAKLKAEKEKQADLQHKAQEKQEAREKAERAEKAAEAKAKADAKIKAEAKARADAEAEAKAEAKADAKAKAEAKAKADAKAEAKAKADKELADKAADKAAKAKQAAADQKTADAARRQTMNRLASEAGSGGSGTAAKSSGPGTDKSYAAAVISKIKNNIAYFGSTDMGGNPRAEFKIEQLPTGEIISIKQTKSSGVPAYDKAVENAINKSSPLPKKKDGTVDRVVDAGFNMKD